MVKNRALRRRDRGNRRQQDRSDQPQQEPPMAEPVPENVASIFRSDELTELCRIWNVSAVDEVSPLVAAVALNKVALVKRLIGDGYDVDSRGPGARTALLEAVRARSLELVDVLAAHGADANLADGDGNTPALLALRDDWWTQDAMVALCGLLPRLELDRVGDVRTGHTVLHHAVRRKWEALVDALLERRAQVDCVTPRGVSPLMLAGCTGRAQLAQRLLAAGADLLLEDTHGCTALCYACATLLVKGRNKETVDLMLRHLTVPLEDYMQRRLHLLRHPPCAAADFAAPVSSIVAQSLYCMSRCVSRGLRALLDVHVFAYVARSLDAHRGCVGYAHALLGLLFDLARHCACCTQRAGVTAAQLAAAFVAGGAPDACLAVLLAHCASAQPRNLPDHLMRLLVAAVLPLAVAFGRSPAAGAGWLERRGADLAPFYAVFRSATHISVSSRTDLLHLRLVRRQLRRFHAVYADATAAAAAAVAQPHEPVLSAEVRLDSRSATTLDEWTASCDPSLTSLESVATTERSSVESVDVHDVASVGDSDGGGGRARFDGDEGGDANARSELENGESLRANGEAAPASSVEARRRQSLEGTLVKSQTFLDSKFNKKIKNRAALRNESRGSLQTSLGNELPNTQSLPSVSSKRQSMTSSTSLVTSKAVFKSKSQVSLAMAFVKLNSQTSSKGSITDRLPCSSLTTLRMDNRDFDDHLDINSPNATSTPKSSAFFVTMSERARRKDAEALKAYRLLPRRLDFAGREASTEVVPERNTTGDSGLGISLDQPLDEPRQPTRSRQNKSCLIICKPSGIPGSATEDTAFFGPREGIRVENYGATSRHDQGGASSLSPVDQEIRQMIDCLEDNALNLSLFADPNPTPVADASTGVAAVGVAPKKSRIQIRLSDRRRLTIVDDLFTALVDALATRWHNEHNANYPGHRVLLSSGQDLTLSHLHRLLPPLERLHLARLARRWRALSRKLHTGGGGAASSVLVGRLSALLQSHLAAIGRSVPASLKRRASWHDGALRKRLRVKRDEEAAAAVAEAGERAIERARLVRRRTLRTLDRRGARAQNLKVIVPRRAKGASSNLKLIAPMASEPRLPQTSCFEGTHYYHHPPPPPPPPPRAAPVAYLAPPPGFAPHHSVLPRFDLRSTVHAEEFRPTSQHQGLQYVHNAVNVQPTPTPTPTPRTASVAESASSCSGVDFASARDVVDYLDLDDDTDFELFLQRKRAERDAGSQRDPGSRRDADDVERHEVEGHDFQGHGIDGHDFDGQDFEGYDSESQDFGGHHDFEGFAIEGHDFGAHDFECHDFHGHDFEAHDFEGHDFDFHDCDTDDFEGIFEADEGAHASTSMRLEGRSPPLLDKWVPLAQPPRGCVTQHVATLRALRHENLVAWETVTMTAVCLRIGCARMDCNLAQAVAGRVLDSDRLLALCQQMARGLRYLHSLSLVHGNLKPTNVLLDDRGVARLADFGIHLLTAPPAAASLWWSSETRAQFARGKRVVFTAEGDAQVLGMLFHFAATGGSHPFVVTPSACRTSDCASYELRQLTQDLLQHESSLRPSLRTALRHVCWWDAQDRRSLVLRCAAWVVDGCAEQSQFVDTALGPLLPDWKVRANEAMPRAAPDTPSALLRMLHAAPQLTVSLLRWLPELPLALHRLAAQTPSLRALLRFTNHSDFDIL